MASPTNRCLIGYLGCVDQLQLLADYLNDTTDLTSRPWPRGPGGQGPVGILSHFLVPMTHYYLLALNDLGEDDRALMERLGR